jgi:type VI secretion system FHA domain protein
MRLVLKTLRCPEGVAAQRREVTGTTFSIGRGTESDWVLPDPNRNLSKLHCRITARDGGWLITDRSSNGTLLNNGALDPDLPYPLRPHDRLVIGKYEFEVELADAPDDDLAEARTRFGVRPDGLNEQRLTSDPFLSLTDDVIAVARPPIGLQLDFDGADDLIAPEQSTGRDDTPDLRANFQAPRSSLELVPEDWDLDAEPEETSPPVPPAPASVAAYLPAPPAPASVAAYLPAPPAPPGKVGRDKDGEDGFAAFAAGAGISNAVPTNAKEIMHTLGAAFRAMVHGLRKTIIARAMVKSEFRIDRTMIRASGNNPLKFSADDDDALAALLGIGRQGGMSAEHAIAETLLEIRLHELATAAAMQSAVRGLLTELAPERMLRSVRRSKLDDLLGRQKHAAWDAYVARHAEVQQALTDDFDSVFGKAFARAYELALASISERERT